MGLKRTDEFSQDAVRKVVEEMGLVEIDQKPDRIIK
jgi:hypothetical protein